MKSIFTTKKTTLLLSALHLTFFMGGCFNLSKYHTARPIEPGITELGMAMEVHGIIEDMPDIDVMTSHPMIFVRRGINEKSDFGLSAGYHGTELDYNYLLLDDEDFALSINPAFGIFVIKNIVNDFLNNQLLSINPSVSILMDLMSRDGFTLTLGLKIGAIVVDDDRFWDLFVYSGLSLGSRIDMNGFFLFPEINLIRIWEWDFDEAFFWTVGLGAGF